MNTWWISPKENRGSEVVILYESKIEFIVEGRPTGKGRTRFTSKGGGRTYTPKATMEYEKKIREEYEKVKLSDWDKESVYRVNILSAMPILKSLKASERKDIMQGKIPCVKKPDIDNVSKIVLDALNNIAYKDDVQIIELYVKRNFAKDNVGYIKVEIIDIQNCFNSNPL